MNKKHDRITRRDFIKSTSAAAIGVATLGLPAFSAEGETKYKSKVILIRNKDAVNREGNISGDIIQQMLDEAVVKLFGNDDVTACWKQIVSPRDFVGIKSNVWKFIPTTSQVENAIKNRVMDAGVPEENIGIDDRSVLANPIFKKATALINARPMRTHAWSGVGSLLKNYITFVNPPDYHYNSCADLGAIWHLPMVKDKTRLNVLVMLTPQFHTAGPHHFDKEFVWNYGGLIVGTDPVACDAVGLKIIQAKRKSYYGDDRPIKPIAHHIQFADTRHNLGTSDMNKIDLVKLGWDEGWLI